MSKLNHTNLAVTSATLASGLQASAATGTTTTTTNCTKAGLAYTLLADPRATTTTTVPITTGGSGSLITKVVDDAETTIA